MSEPVPQVPAGASPLAPASASTPPVVCPAEVAVIGGGPAGLMAAQVLSAGGARVRVYDAMASVGRKFLLAGRGGLNLTHSEAPEHFLTRYGERQGQVATWLADFGSADVCAWAEDLGSPTFVGSSGRVFPQHMKAAPLLRAWLHRLRAAGVQFSMRHRWQGWDADGQLCFATPAGPRRIAARVQVLALGGGSWARLGSDGAWVNFLLAQGASVAPLVPANCGFDVAGAQGQGWTPYFSGRFAGQPFKSVAIRVRDSRGRVFERKGEFVATQSGVEGSLIYAASHVLRDEIAAQGHAGFELDLLPDRRLEQVLAEVRHPRGSRSMGSHLKGRLGLEGIKSAVLHELLDPSAWQDPEHLARAIKGLWVALRAPRPLDEAISSAGGLRLEGLDADLRLTGLAPGGAAVFCAGEMLDWEAPTGGYLLTAALASGHRAGRGALARWQSPDGAGQSRP